MLEYSTLYFSIYCSVLFGIANSQQLIDLKAFRGENVKNFINATVPFNIFVSASSDDAAILRQIEVVNEDGENQTLYQLAKRKPFKETSQIQPFAIQKSAYITTNLTDNQMNSLTGMMFVSSTRQFQVGNFYVIDIDKYQAFALTKEPDGANNTFLFLNSWYNTTAFQSSIISSWRQPSTSSIFVYKGIPNDGGEPLNTTIFSNPVMSSSGKSFFPMVEKFSLSLGAFYFESYGGVDFEIAPGYYDLNNSSTHDYTTTGFYMKPINQNDKTVIINTIRCPACNGTVGANIVGTLPDGGMVTVKVQDGTTSYEKSIIPTDVISGWSTQNVGQTFQISSTKGLAGEYFVQYYIYQNGQNPESTTTPIQATTKQSSHYFSTLPFLSIFSIYLIF